MIKVTKLLLSVGMLISTFFILGEARAVLPDINTLTSTGKMIEEIQSNVVKYSLTKSERLGYYEILADKYRWLVSWLENPPTVLDKDCHSDNDIVLTFSGYTGGTQQNGALGNRQIWEACDIGAPFVGQSSTMKFSGYLRKPDGKWRSHKELLSKLNSLCSPGYTLPSDSQLVLLAKKSIETGTGIGSITTFYRDVMKFEIHGLIASNTINENGLFPNSMPTFMLNPLKSSFRDAVISSFLKNGIDKLHFRCIKTGSFDNSSYSVKNKIPYKAQATKSCTSARFDGNNKIQDYVWKDTQGKITEIIASCSQPRRENGGLICADKVGCCLAGEVAVNGKCVTINDVGGSCYADSGCKDGLECTNNVCKQKNMSSSSSMSSTEILTTIEDLN